MKTIENWSLDKIYEHLKNEDVKVEDKISFISKKTNNTSKRLSIGRIWFNLLLPENYPLVDEPVTKDKMNSIIKDLINKYEPEEAADIISKIQKHAFIMSSINPSSLHINAFIMPQEWKDKKEKFKEDADGLSDSEFLSRANELTKELITYLKDNNIGIQDVLISGTKGGIDDWQTLLVSRGFVVDIEGNISRITEANNDGYSIESYYKGGGQARRNYYVKSTMTSKPGYLARRVTMACANIKVSNNDCGAKKYLELTLDKGLAKKFVNRNYVSGQKYKQIIDPNDVIGKKLKIRSPLYCKEKNGLCEVCYGDGFKVLNNKNVGIIAGGAINNETINALMKMRHLASQVNIVEVDFPEILIKSQVDRREILKVLEVEKNKIIAKTDITIELDKKDYREELFSDFGNRYHVPGILEISYGESENIKTITLPFNFEVNLYKPENIEESGSIIRLYYSEGEKIIQKEKYLKQMNPAVIDRLFEAGMKHLSKPEILLSALMEELSKIDSVHLELVVANMFRSENDLTIPGRLVNYENCRIIGCKAIPFHDSWLSALAFENIGKAIRVGIVDEKDATLNPIEEVIIDKYYNEEANI